MIDTYLTELGAALRGPRRAKADLLAESRDGLIDAAEAYESGGLCRDDAQRQAVADFGTLEELVPAYQAELSLAQGKRTALLVLFVFAAQPFLWNYAYRWVTNTSINDPRTGYAFADDLVKTFGSVTLLVSLLGVLTYGIGLRHNGIRTRIAKLTGAFALAVAVSFAVLGTLLAVLSKEPTVLLTLVHYLWMVAFVLVPVTWIARSAGRCLASVA